MQLNEVKFGQAVPIDGYGPGFFRVEGKVIEGHVLMLPSGAKSWSGFDDLECIIRDTVGVDVLFIGMGAEIAMPSEQVQQELRAAGIAFEAMGTGARLPDVQCIAV